MSGHLDFIRILYGDSVGFILHPTFNEQQSGKVTCPITGLWENYSC